MRRPVRSTPIPSYEGDFRRFKDEYAETMRRMFAAVGDLYGEYWADWFHFAIYEEGIEQTWEEALARTHERYLRDLRVDRATRILEVACGRGGFSELMARRRTSADVLGVDISPAQLRWARKRRARNLHFRRHDAMALARLERTFDAAVCLDAACYFPDKRRAAESFASVLEPGARLLLVDWCKREGATAIQEELVLHPFMHAWAIPSLETARGWEANLSRAGFRLLQVEDLNDHTKPNWEMAYSNALRALEEVSSSQLPKLIWKGMHLGTAGIRMMKEQFKAALYIKAGFDSGLLRYVLCLAERLPQGRRAGA